MKTVVFLVYHGMGHFNACFRMAKMLSREYDVVFAGVEFFKNYMESQGFMYYPLKTVPFGMGFEKWVSEQNKNKFHYFHVLKYRWANKIYADREAELLQLMYDLEPDYLFIDSLQSTDFFVLYPCLRDKKTKVGLIQTMLPTQVDENKPPLNSLALPHETSEIKSAITRFNLRRFKKMLWQKVIYLGMDDATIIKAIIKRNHIPTRYISRQQAILGASLTNIHELIVAPREFDFHESSPNSNQHYVGFLPELNRIEISHVEYFKRDETIRKKIQSTSAQLIYCSFGTVKSEYTRMAASFLQKLINIARRENYVVIIAGNNITQKTEVLQNIPDNVFILKAVPQIEILSRADAFITHGGINSIKESIYMAVPMLVYPMHEATDCFGNSSRVVYHRLGLRGDLIHDTEDEIAEKLKEIVNNDSYRKNIYALRDVDEQYAEKFMTYFNDLQPIE